MMGIGNIVFYYSNWKNALVFCSVFNILNKMGGMVPIILFLIAKFSEKKRKVKK
jgi:hypothetical protein